MALTNKIKSTLMKRHGVWSRFVPSFYFPYRFAGGRIYLNIQESPMMLARVFGSYENAKHRALHSYLGPGKTFVDVGVNKGDFSLLAARIVGDSGRVIAFEPAPDNCRWIRRSIEKNGYANIALHELALSSENGTAQLHIGKKSGWHSLIPGQPDRDEGVVEVQTRALDDFLEQIGFSGPIDVMKIDVEGADMQVLRGARRTLADNPGIVLLLDIHPDLGVDPAEVFGFLHELGFRLYRERPPFTEELTAPEAVLSVVARRS